MATASKIFDGLLDAMAFLAALILIGLMLATVVKVGLREITGTGVIGIDQLSGTALVYLAFFGGAWVLRSNGHVTIDLLIGNSQRKMTRAFVVLNSVIGAIVCFTLLYFGADAAWSSWQRGVVVAAELEIPRAVGLLPIPIGFLLLGIEFLRRAVRAYKGDIQDAGVSAEV